MFIQISTNARWPRPGPVPGRMHSSAVYQQRPCPARPGRVVVLAPAAADRGGGWALMRDGGGREAPPPTNGRAVTDRAATDGPYNTSERRDGRGRAGEPTAAAALPSTRPRASCCRLGGGRSVARRASARARSRRRRLIFGGGGEILLLGGADARRGADATTGPDQPWLLQLLPLLLLLLLHRQPGPGCVD